MVAWTGLEHFRVGRFNPPPPAIEPDDYVVRSLNKEQYFKLKKWKIVTLWLMCVMNMVWSSTKVASWRGVRTGEKRSSFFENRTRSSVSYFKSSELTLFNNKHKRWSSLRRRICLTSPLILYGFRVKRMYTVPGWSARASNLGLSSSNDSIADYGLRLVLPVRDIGWACEFELCFSAQVLWWGSMRKL